MEEALARIAETIRDHKEVLATEEAAKNALVMPFLQALGYNVFNPGEVVPEFVADVGRKKGEKVDYAICENGEVRMLVECKPSNCELKVENATQLYRYFGATSARLAVLTNGVAYRFYSDVDAPNVMDKEPFFTCRLDDLKGNDQKVLARFAKSDFDIGEIVKEARDLKIQALVRARVQQEMDDPSGPFIRHIANDIHEGRLMPAVVDQYGTAIKRAFSAIVRDRVDERLKRAVAGDLDHEDDPVEISEIQTTEDELQGRDIIRAIAAEIIDPARIDLRDAKAYCPVLLDDNNRKSVVRLRFNSATTKYLGVMKGKEETQHHLESPLDIYKFRSEILDRIRELEG